MVAPPAVDQLRQIGPHGGGPAGKPVVQRGLVRGRFGQRGQADHLAAFVRLAQPREQVFRLVQHGVQLVVARQRRIVAQARVPQIGRHLDPHFVQTAARCRQAVAKRIAEGIVGPQQPPVQRGHASRHQRRRAGLAQIPRQRVQPLRRDLQSEELGRHLFDLMGLVEDDDVVRGQHLGIGPVRLEGQIRKEQVVVGQDHLGAAGVLAHAGDETAFVVQRTVCPGAARARR